MRKRMLVMWALVLGLGLLLLLLLFRSRMAETSVASALSGSTLARAPGAPKPGPSGAVGQPEHPEGVGGPGAPEAGAEGFLEVEVLEGERPIPGANVRLYERGGRDPNVGEVSWRRVASGSTDERGRLRLASGPGDYFVAVRAPDKAPGWRDVVRPSGEALTHLRVTLEAGHGLVGRTVVRGTGEPLPLVTLSFIPHGRKLEDWEAAEAPEEERVYATSDARGAFRVEGLASGAWALWARAPGHGQVFLRDVRVPATEPLEVALSRAGVIEGFVVDASGRPAPGAEVLVNGGYPPVVVTTGPGGGFSAEVEAGPHGVSARRGDEAGALDSPVVVAAGGTVRGVRVRLGAGARFEGRVVARRSGAPVVGATVHVSPAGEHGDSGRAVTDERGHYAIGGLAAGAHDVVVTAPGFSEFFQRGVTLAPGERFLLEAELSGVGAVEGTVRDAAGRPLEGVRVVVGERWWLESLSTTRPEARTNAEGVYRLEGLAVGQVLLSAHREGVDGGGSRYVQVQEGDTARADFVFEETGIVEGVVRVASGPRPARPLQVHALPRRAYDSPDQGSTGSTEVDASGFFRLVLPPGGYEVVADHPEEGGPRQREPEFVRVESGRTLRLELVLEEPEYPRGQLRGRVLEPDGTPSPGALVSGRGPTEEARLYFMVSADAEGRFETEAPSEIPLRIQAGNGGHLGTVEGARTGREVVVRLQPAGTLRGRVVRPGGAPVRGFVLGLRAMNAQESLWAGYERRFSGERFEVKGLPGEPLMVEVHTEDGARGGTLVPFTPGASTELELVVRDTARVRGRLLDLEGRAPVAGVTVFVSSSLSVAPSITGADGRFLLEGLPEGEHTVGLGVNGDVKQLLVEVKEGQELDLGDMPLP